MPGGRDTARRTGTLAALLATLALLCVALVAAAAPAGAKRVRVFAVGPKFELSWVESRTTFRGKLLALMDRRRRRGAPAVQRGLTDVAGNLLGPAGRRRPARTARDLVALPEDLGLFAALTGSRGKQARAVTPEGGGLTFAIVTLLGTYGPQINYYKQRFPALADRPLGTRLLTLALTDTDARTAVETYAELADRYDVYLEAGVNMAHDWRVVCRNRAAFNRRRPLPGGVRCAQQSPTKVAQLQTTDEPGRDYAYEATSPDAANMALLFDPDGRLVSKQVKSYLTPIELPGQLDLKPGGPGSLSVVKTPVGRLGFVTSKDAWMPDVTARLDQRHAEVLVQPEFFVNDTVSLPGMFSPDTLKAAGYNDLLRHPAMEALVLPELTGNVYDFSADAQSHIALKPGQGRRAGSGHLVGQPAVPGFAKVAPWVVGDPLGAGEPFAARRDRLRAAGSRLLPGSGTACPAPDVPGACRGGQQETILFKDITVGRTRFGRASRARGQTPFSASRRIAPGRAPQRNGDVAVNGDDVFVAYESRVRGRDNVQVAVSRDGGLSWGRPVHPTGQRAGRRDEWAPAIAAGPDGRVYVAWQDARTGTQRVWLAVSADGRRFSKPVQAATAAAGEQATPALAAAGPGAAVLAWVGYAARSPQGLPLGRAYVARVGGGGTQVGAPVRVGGGTPAPLAADLDNAWAPDVAVRGDRVAVAWVEFRDYDWDVFAAESADGGRSFGPDQVVNDTPADREALDDAPAVTLGASGPLVAFTDWRKRDSAQTAPHQAYDVFAARRTGPAFTASPNVHVDPWGTQQVSSFSPAAVDLGGDEALVAWQDAKRGDNDILIRRLRAAGPAPQTFRVDDSGTSPANQWRPALALAGGVVYAVWEDERSGVAQITFARAQAGAIP